MSTERVGKNWQSMGIDTFSTPAILGTLAHYGVTIDEAEYQRRASEDFPFAIASEWQQKWKGTGQFAPFPASASEELWRRLMKGDICPSDMAIAMIQLCVDSAALITQKKLPDTLEARYRVLEAYVPRVPPTGDRREKFMAEVVWILADTMEQFDTMAAELARAEQNEQAVKFATLEELIFPVRKDVARAVVEASIGDKAKAIETLKQVTTDTSRDDFNRLGANAVLIDLGELNAAVPLLYSLCDRAQAEKDFELGSALADQMSEMLKANPKFPERNALRERLIALATALEPQA